MGARRTGSATGAPVRALPWLVRMGLADPAGVIAEQALHQAAAFILLLDHDLGNGRPARNLVSSRSLRQTRLPGQTRHRK